MKKLAILILSFLFVLTLAYALLQSNIGKNWIRQSITQNLAESGIRAEIGEIQGALPSQIRLKNVSVKGEGIELQIQEVELRPILWRFLKKEIAFKDIQAKKVVLFQTAPFDFEGKFWMDKEKANAVGKVDGWQFRAKLELNSRLLEFSAKNPLFNIKGNAPLDANYQVVAANIQFSSDDLLEQVFPALKGRVLGIVSLSQKEGGIQGKATWQIPDLLAGQTKIGPLKGEAHATFANSTLVAELSTNSQAKISFNWEIRPGMLIVGNNRIQIENLHQIPIQDTYGKLEGQLLWTIVDGAQDLKWDATVEQFYYKDFFAQKAVLYSDLKNPFSQISGLFDLSFEQAKWRELRLESISFSLDGSGEQWPFHIDADGEWKHPLELHINGNLKNANEIRVENLNGTFFNHPLLLLNPVDLTWTQTEFFLPNVQIQVADALLTADIQRKRANSDILIQFDRMPLDFLSLNPLDVPVEGKFDLKAEIHEADNRLKGDLSLNLLQTSPFDANGAFEANFNRNQFQLKGNLNVGEEPLANVDAVLPIHFAVWPFKAEVLPYGEARGRLSFNGQVEDVLDFFDLGPHRLEGTLKGELTLKNTLYRPFVEGVCTFENGSYENYYTGTKLENIEADFIAEKNIAYLRSFSALDEPGDGAISATGQIKLNQTELYPFHFKVQLDDFQFTGVDLVTASADGNIDIQGNLTSALASGKLLITESSLTIPDHIRRPLPELNVVYVNPDRPVPLPSDQSYSPYPVYLDLQVSAPEVLILGRGLDSHWKGDFHVGGSLTNIATQGELQLDEGSFNFAGKSFSLNNGSLLFSGIEHEMPKIDLSAIVETKGVLITAQLHGPLDNPQITLHSNPPLPLGSIMSYLLFGQELSEISGFQALEIASSIASIAGSGPDVMESTRRSLGVDRLRIIADGDGEDGQTVSLEVGKYVAKGVLVTLTQGVQESSTNIKIEVELKGNIILQLESDQHQEQGKFTLKWRVNY